MRNPGGYGITTSPVARTQEEDTFTCVHCNAIIVVLPPRSATSTAETPLDTHTVAANAIPWCGHCGKPICKGCNGKPCTPFMKLIDAMEAKARRRQEIFG